MDERLTDEQIAEIEARRTWHFLAIMRERVANGFALMAGLPDYSDRAREHYCNDAADLLDHIDASHRDIDALLAEVKALRAELAEASKGWAESNRMWDEKRVEAHRLGAELEAEQKHNERLRARIAELETPREGILATAQALRLKINEAAGQEGD